jgi:DNA gyrase subunit A
VTIRKNEYIIAQKKYREHILEGLKIALDNLDEIIKTIRESETQEKAKTNLIKGFDLTDVQAQAILDMQLRRLAALERQKIEDEYKEVQKSIKELEALLADPDKITKVVRKELLELKEKYGDERRTKVFKGDVEEIAEEDLVAEEETFVTVSHQGYIKRMAPSTYKTQKRGGKGVIGAKTKENDFIEHAITCSTHDEIVFFTNQGKCFEIKAYEIPEYGRTAKGLPAVNLIQIDQDELITAILTRSKKGFVDEDQIQEDQVNDEDGKDADAKAKKKSREEKAAENKYLLMATKNGITKKTEIGEFENIRSNGLIAINLNKGDELKWVRPSSGDDQVILISKYGRSIRFHEEDVRDTGRNTKGVTGIKFKQEDDEVISMDIVRAEEHRLLTISANGYGKMTPLSKYPLQGRAGQGVYTFRVTDKTGNLVVARTLDTPDKEIVLISRDGQVIRSELNEIAELGRHTSGVKVMKLNKEDTVAAMALM